MTITKLFYWQGENSPLASTTSMVTIPWMPSTWVTASELSNWTQPTLSSRRWVAPRRRVTIHPFNQFNRSIQSIQPTHSHSLMLWCRRQEVQTGWVLAHLQWQQKRQGYGNLRGFHGVHEVVRQSWKRPHDRCWVVPYPRVFGSVYTFHLYRRNNILIVLFLVQVSVWLSRKPTTSWRTADVKKTRMVKSSTHVCSIFSFFLSLSFFLFHSFSSWGGNHRQQHLPEYFTWDEGEALETCTQLMVSLLQTVGLNWTFLFTAFLKKLMAGHYPK